MRLGHFAILACAAIHLACGGVNMSDDQRTPARAASGDDDDLEDDAFDAGQDAGASGEETSEAQAPMVADAGGGDADSGPPVPPGSFAVGTELETTADLNLREGPGTDFAVVLTMPAASRVKVQTTSGADGWVHVDYQGTIGYASKMFLKVP